MAKYEMYAEYKDSGVEWLEGVPADWDIIKIKHLSSVKRGASPRPIDDPKFFDDNGDYAWVRISDVSASDMYLLNTTQTMSVLGSSLSVKLEPNELFLSIAGTVGKPCINKIKACIHDGFVYFPDLKIPNKYLFYIFAGEQAYKGLGKMGTQLNLNTDTVGDIKVALPKSKIDIQGIIDFLDHETAKIDSLIEKQQQLIQLLQEKRQTVISHVVTKGLNPNMPMKDSGVEWLGQVPEHWKVAPIKRIIYLMEQGKSPECENIPATLEQWGVLKTSCVNNGIFHSQQNKALPEHTKPHTQYQVKAGDVLMSRASGSINLIGSVALVPNDVQQNLLLSDKIFRIHLTKDCDARFFTLLMATPYMRTLIERAISGAEGMANNITKTSILEFVSAIPPLKEQMELVNCLTQKIQVFDSLVLKATKAIEVMQERRTAIISSAVTGKIDVRQWQNPNKNNEAKMELSA